MKILIISAMVEELLAIKENFKFEAIDRINNQDVYILNGNKTIYLMNTGIGKVNGALTTSMFLSKYEVDIILNIGTCGSLAKNLAIGDFIYATKLAYHDVDITAFGRKKGYLPDIEKYSNHESEDEEIKRFILIEKKDDIVYKSINNFGEKINKGSIVTGDAFICEIDKKKEIIDEFSNPLGVEMESTAIVQAALAHGKNIHVLRSVSDNAFEEANVDFDKYLLEVTKKYVLLVSEIING